MTSVDLYRHTCSLVAVLLTVCSDPVFAQSGDVSWEAVGISWALSTLTTCILIAVAFGIRRCLEHKKDVKTSNDDEEGDVEQVERGDRRNVDPAVLDQHDIITSPDKQNSGLLSVSQQSAYLRAQNDAGKKNKRKSQPRRAKSDYEPCDWVEQWCEEQAKRESVVAALQTVNDGPIPGANVHRDQMLRYPAGLDLPSSNVRHSTRNDRNEDAAQNITSSPAHIYAEPKHLQSREFRKETAVQKPAGQNLVADARALEDKQTVRNSSHLQILTRQTATAVTVGETVSKEFQNIEVTPSKTAADVPVVKSRQSVLKTETVEELKSSPIRVRRHPRETQKRTDLSQPSAKTKVLEFKRPPMELDPVDTNEAALQNRKDQVRKEIVDVDKGEAKRGAPSQKQEATTSSSSEEETEEESEDERVHPAPLRSSKIPTAPEGKEKLLSSQTRGNKRSLSPSADQNESQGIATAAHPTKSSALSVVDSTPPTPTRPTSVRRVPRQSKPSVLNIVPVPSEGVSPPPGLLPLTASSHHQITKSQRQAMAAAVTVSQVAEDKPRRKTAKKDEQKAVERRQKSPKKDKSTERPAPFDFKSKRASTGSDILFFAPELQGTSTPAMRPKSAFLPASVPLLSSHDTADDEDDDDEPLKSASSPKAGAVAPSFLTQRPRISQSQQFHGILSNGGLHELAHGVYHEWRQLANSLQVPAEHQAKLVESHSGDAEKCTYAMLRGWRDRFSGSKAELRSLLCAALVAVKHPEMAEKLIQEEMVGSSEKLDNLKLVSVV